MINIVKIGKNSKLTLNMLLLVCILSVLCGFNFREVFRKVTIIIVTLFGISVPPIQSVDIVTGTYDRALYEIYDLRTITAQRIIDEERTRDTANLYCEYLENWKEVIELLVFADDERYETYQTSLDARLERFTEKGDRTLPSYNILLAEIYAHACLANVMYGDFLPAFRKLVKTNKLAKENLENHPDYWLNDKLVGIMNVSFDKIPSVLRWLTNLFGLRGDAESGFRMMDQYLSHVQDYPGLKSEILVYYVFGLRLSRDEGLAYELFAKEMDREQAPLLALYLQASFMYMTGKNEEALNLMFSFPTDRMEVPFSFVDFLRGKLKLNRLDQDADRYLLAFLEHSKFKNYKREVCMKLAYHYYLIGNEEKYSFYKDLVPTHPKSTTNRDREADVERERPYEPHREILKARHLVSGEYYERAFSSLSKVDTGDLDQEAYLAEYFLLKGKVKSNLSDDGEAMEWYDKAIKIGRNSKEQYAAEAALYAGMEAQAKGEPGKAIDYWELALKINGQKDVYIEYIHDKANNLLSKNGNGKHARYQAGMANVPGD